MTQPWGVRYRFGNSFWSTPIIKLPLPHLLPSRNALTSFKVAVLARRLILNPPWPPSRSAGVCKDLHAAPASLPSPPPDISRLRCHIFTTDRGTSARHVDCNVPKPQTPFPLSSPPYDPAFSTKSMRRRPPLKPSPRRSSKSTRKASQKANTSKPATTSPSHRTNA